MQKVVKKVSCSRVKDGMELIEINIFYVNGFENEK
jgi:hypothetical protein